jgi:hypothetical protein
VKKNAINQNVVALLHFFREKLIILCKYAFDDKLQMVNKLTGFSPILFQFFTMHFKNVFIEQRCFSTKERGVKKNIKGPEKTLDSALNCPLIRSLCLGLICRQWKAQLRG